LLVFIYTHLVKIGLNGGYSLFVMLKLYSEVGENESGLLGFLIQEDKELF